MKAYLKWLAIFVVIAIVLVPMVLKGPNGESVMTVADWLPDSVGLDKFARQAEALKREAVQDESSAETGSPTATASSGTLSNEQLQDSPSTFSSSSGKMYKWQDDKGRWHFSSQKPSGEEAVSIDSLPDIENVMQPTVTAGGKSSTIGLPGIGSAGDLLDKLQQITDNNE